MAGQNQIANKRSVYTNVFGVLQIRNPLCGLPLDL